jgi:hypothetical protein
VNFQKCNHLRNPMNESKPIKICRDGQEVPGHIAYELCKIIDSGDDFDISCETLTIRGGPAPPPSNAVPSRAHARENDRYNYGRARGYEVRFHRLT